MSYTKEITLDIYDRAKKPASINVVACDNDSREILAKITAEGELYDITENDQVSLVLTIIRPDKSKTEIECYSETYEVNDEEHYGIGVTLNSAAINTNGKYTAQFKIVAPSPVGTQTTRTDIFYIDAAEALDAVEEAEPTVETMEIDPETELPLMYGPAGEHGIGNPTLIEKAVIGSTHKLAEFDDYNVLVIKVNDLSAGGGGNVLVKPGTEVTVTFNDEDNRRMSASIGYANLDSYIILDANNHEGSHDRFKNSVLGVEQIFWDLSLPLPADHAVTFTDSSHLHISSWNTSPNGDGSGYSPENSEILSALSELPAGTILYAQWSSSEN